MYRVIFPTKVLLTESDYRIVVNLYAFLQLYIINLRWLQLKQIKEGIN